ncbi:MAG: polymer-forming cytoskeletal protein [Lachnospiraceae bacterium]|nr:polymer-forming cytoskeletal protein [Lachnospiraceae bacterium]
MGKRTNDYVTNRVNTIVGKGVTFDGVLDCGKETVRIEGIVKGTIYSQGNLIIGNGGVVNGTIKGTDIFVGGTVNGEIYSVGHIEVNCTGEIYGDLYTKSLIVDDKGIFEGRCDMTSDILID